MASCRQHSGYPGEAVQLVVHACCHLGERSSHLGSNILKSQYLASFHRHMFVSFGRGGSCVRGAGPAGGYTPGVVISLE